MPLITLISDWNNKDFYVGMIKGKVLSRVPEASLVDISHEIEPFNLSQAAFVLRNSYPHYPPGTIHLVLINTEPEPGQAIIAALYEGHYFIGTDNGVFGLLFKSEPEKIVKVPFENMEFPSVLDAYTTAACQLLSGEALEQLGEATETFQKQLPRRAVIEESVINGSVIYIDSYQNAFTNITRDLFDRIGKGRPFEIFLSSNHYRIDKITMRYGEVPVGELVVIFNSLDLLEIAINKGPAVQLLNLMIGSTIRVKFFENKQMARMKQN